MAITYRCDKDLRCTFIVWDADVTPEQWRDHSDRMWSDPTFPPGPLMLADLSTANGAPSVSSEVVVEMAASLRERAAKVRPIRVAVIPNGAWDKALVLERDTEGSGLTTIVFNDLATACTWLGLSEDAAKPILAKLRADC